MSASWQTVQRHSIDDLSTQPNLRLGIGEHLVDIGALRVVSRPTQPRLTSKAAAVLVELVRHAGNTVTRDQLLDRVWKDRVTTPDVLTQVIKELRRAFDDVTKPSRYIETIPKVGYRLLASVSIFDGVDASTMLSNAMPVNAAAASVSVDSGQADIDDEDDVSTGVNASTAISPSKSHANPSRGWLWVLGAMALLVLALFVLARQLFSTSSTSHEWVPANMRAVTSYPGSERRPHVSPDGTRIAYAKLDPVSGIDRIFIRSIEQSQPVQLTARADANEEMPIWSPDGTKIAFVRVSRANCTIYVAQSFGGAESAVGACTDSDASYLDWTPDGKRLITAERMSEANGDMTLVQWDLATGAKQSLDYQHAADDQDVEPRYSPSGSLIAFRRGLAPYSDLCVMSANGGEVHQLTHLASLIHGYTWTADNRALIFSSNHEGRFTLYTLQLDSGRVQKVGVTAAEYPDAARAAKAVVYEIPHTNSTLAQIGISLQPAAGAVIAPSTGSDSAPVVSPDGERIAFISDRSGSQQLWLYETVSTATTALTEYKDAVLLNPSWSQDGRKLLITVRTGAKASLVEIDLATRRQVIVSKPDEDVRFGIFAGQADSYLITVGANSRHNQLILVQNATSAQATHQIVASSVGHADFDPAEQMVYYTKMSEQGLFRRDLHQGDEQFVTSLISATMTDGWRVVDGNIWYLDGIDLKPTLLRVFTPSSQEDRLLGRLDVELRGSREFSVLPKRDGVILTPLGTEDTDVGAFDMAAAER